MDMNSFKKKNNCPCSKGEYCANGLKCTKQNCFLLKSSTLIIIPPTIPIERRNPLRYKQSRPRYSSKHHGFGWRQENGLMEKKESPRPKRRGFCRRAVLPGGKQSGQAIVKNTRSLARKFHATEVFICKAFRDAAVVYLPPVLDNAANGRVGQHPTCWVVAESEA